MHGQNHIKYNDAACQTTSWRSTDVCKKKKLAPSTLDTNATLIYPLTGRRPCSWNT